MFQSAEERADAKRCPNHPFWQLKHFEDAIYTQVSNNIHCHHMNTTNMTLVHSSKSTRTTAKQRWHFNIISTSASVHIPPPLVTAKNGRKKIIIRASMKKVRNNYKAFIQPTIRHSNPEQ